MAAQASGGVAKVEREALEIGPTGVASPDLQSRSRAVGRGAVLAALFVSITLTMFFQLGQSKGRPTLTDLDDVVLVASPDGPLVIWILSWSAHALRNQPLRLFEANMFYPSENSLAYTESLAPLAPIWALLRGWTGDPFLALNLLLLMITILNMCGGYLLVNWLTGRTDAGILAAVLFAFNGYASAQRVHLQLQVMFLVPIAFLLLFKWLEERRQRDAVLLAVTWAVLSVTVVYYGMIFSLMVAVVLAGYILSKRWRPGRGFASGLVVIIGILGFLATPFAAAYVHVRTADPVSLPGHDLALIDLVTPSVGSLFYRELEAIGEPRSEEHRHFPGFLAIVLGTVGLWVVFGGRGSHSCPRWSPPLDRRTYCALLATAGAFCLVLAFGAEARGIPLPYSLLYEYLPGFDRIRVPSRIAFGTIVAGTVLAAVGYARLTASLWRSGGVRLRSIGVLVAVAAISFVGLENASQTRLFPRPVTPEEAAVNWVLARAPAGAVLELPIAVGVGAKPARMEAKRFMLSTIDWKPRVNGYSGGYPPGYFRRAVELNRFPAPRGLHVICELNVRYVVLRVADPASHPRLTPREAAGILSRLPRHARWEQHGRDYLIDLEDWLEWRGGQCPVPAPLNP